MPSLPIQQIQARGLVPEISADIGSGGAGAVASGIAGLVAGGVARIQSSVEQERQQREMELKRQQANEADIQIINAQSRLQLRAHERLRELEGSEQGLAGATATLMKEFDGWAKDEDSAASSLAKPKLATALARMRGQLNEQVYNAETNARRQKLLTDFETGLDDGRRLVYADPSQFAPELARRLALADALDLPADARAKLTGRSREQLAFGAASALAERDPDAFLQRAGVRGGKTGKDGKPIPVNADEAAKAVKNDPILANLAPEAMQQVVNRATMLSVQRQAAIEAEQERRLRQAEIYAAKREREANQAFTVLSDWSRNGIVADPVAAKPLLDKIAGTPYAAAYAEAAKQIPARTAAAMLPIAAQQAQLDGLIAQRNANGTSQGLENEIEAREQILKATQSAYDDDGLRAALQRNVIRDLAPLNTSNLDSVIAGLPARASQASTAQVQAGRAISPLTSQEAGAVSDQLLALGVEQRSQRIAQLSASMTATQAQALAQQINNKDRALALQFAAGVSKTTSDRFVSEWIGRGAQAIKDKAIKEDATVMTGLRASIAAELGDALTGRAREDVIDAARFVYFGQQAAGLGVTPQGAVRLAIGGNLVDYNGRKLPVPAGMDENGLKGAVSRLGPQQIQQQAPGGQVLLGGGKPMAVADLIAALPGVQLEPAGKGRYSLRSGGALVTDLNRRPIIIGVQ